MLATLFKDSMTMACSTIGFTATTQVAFLTLLTLLFPAVVYSHTNLRLKLLIEAEDMEIDMIKLKEGTVKWEDGLPQFIEKVRDVVDYAKRINAGEEFVYSADYKSENIHLVNLLRSKMTPNGYRNGPKQLYEGISLFHLDNQRRAFALSALTSSKTNSWLSNQCQTLQYVTNVYMENRKLTITHVCTDLNTCATVPRPYDPADNPKSVHRDEDVTLACTADKKCNVNKALPMMTGMFYSIIYDLETVYHCCSKLEDEDYCINYRKAYDMLLKDGELLVAYAYSQQTYWHRFWKDFLSNVVAGHALEDVDVAIETVKENEKHFLGTRIACRSLRLNEACMYDDIYKQYLLLKRFMDNDHKEPIRDLRLHSNMDHSKVAELQAIHLQQTKVLAKVTKINDNLQTTAAGIGNFYQGLAKFDQGIAEADVAFIEGELKKYETSMTKVQTKLIQQFTEAMLIMTGVLGGALADKLTLLAAKIATNSNPLKLIFSGPDVADILALAGEVASATVDLARGTALIVAVKALAKDSEKFVTAFANNKQQLSTLESVKNQIINGNAFDLDENADKFLEEYGAYTPQVDRSTLARNDALWAAYKDSVCGLMLDTDVGLYGSVAKGVGGIQLMCEELEGILAQFFTLRENIFDFQFQLVDAIAAVIRGNMAQRLAQNIKGEVVNGADIMIGFLDLNNNMQEVASLLCDTIKYRQSGTEFAGGCKKRQDGLYTEQNINALAAYTGSTSTEHKEERFVKIPTRPSYKGDTAYIDLISLARGNEVVFKLPKNMTWLQEHGWLSHSENDGKVPFLKTLELFLPRKNYNPTLIPSESTTEVTLQSMAGSSLSLNHPNTGVVYMLPRGSGTYRTSYQENYLNCPKEIPNPYSLCANLHNLCLLSSRHPGPNALLPTILSTWGITLKMSKGANKLTWDVPHPATNLMLRAKVELRLPYLSKKRSHIPKLDARSGVASSTNRCCDTGNTYWDDGCVACPAHSTSHVRGLYCEINKTPQNN